MRLSVYGYEYRVDIPHSEIFFIDGVRYHAYPSGRIFRSQYDGVRGGLHLWHDAEQVEFGTATYLVKVEDATFEVVSPYEWLAIRMVAGIPHSSGWQLPREAVTATRL